MTPPMLDLRRVVDNIDEVRAAIATRSEKDAAALDPLAGLADARRKVIAEVEVKQAARNAASKTMASVDKSSPEFAEKRGELKQLSGAIKALEKEQSDLETDLKTRLSHIPNIPHASSPIGNSEEDNVETYRHLEPQVFDFEPKSHHEIGTALKILDFERGAKLSGPRFTVLRDRGARLERALTNFMIDLHTGEHGYVEMGVPALVKGETLFGTGQLPKFGDDVFKTTKKDPTRSYDLYLSPTAEVTLTNLFGGEILADEDLTIAVTAQTPCFRSEAGSYGRDVRGMIRQHQFHKVELVRICRPQDAERELETMTSHAEAVLKKLGLVYRRVQLCTGDMGFSASKGFDLEVWLPSQQKYREISSCSMCGDFQARRANIRYRPEAAKKPQFVHTLNGSGLAVGRTLVALLEQGQQADGSVLVPEVLQAAMGTDRMVVP